MSGNNFDEFWLSKLPFGTYEDLIEDIYLKAIIESYKDIDKSAGLENEIRDRFYWHLKKHNPLTKDLIDRDILDLSFERWEMLSESEKSRGDLSFFISFYGKFEIECKRLFQQPSRNEAYLEDGLKRFVELKYAEKSEYAGMMGFVISNEIEKIRDELICKIDNFHSSKMKINTSKINWEHRHISLHEKINNDKIQVYHLFFQFTDN
jgi:hypothetical protein